MVVTISSKVTVTGLVATAVELAAVELADLDVLDAVLDAVTEVDTLVVEPEPLVGVWFGGQDPVEADE